MEPGSRGVSARRFRVALAEPSPPQQRLLRELLAPEAGIELCGVAATALGTLEVVARQRPELLLIDGELALRGSPALLATLRQRQPGLPILLLCAPSAAGAAQALAGLRAGAQDYWVRGAGAEHAPPREPASALLSRLGEVLRACEAPRGAAPAPGSAPRGRAAAPRRVTVVVIAVSTGGPAALAQLVAGFPAALRVPVLIAQHMPAGFTARLAESLSRGSKLRALEASDQQKLEPSRIYVAPGDRHLLVERRALESQLRLDAGPPENSCRPSADPLFRSAARAFGSGVLAVVMTGMGRDGFAGCEAVRAAGGQVLAQDAGSSMVWGMAGAVAQAGLADDVLPLGELAAEIVRRVAAA